MVAPPPFLIGIVGDSGSGKTTLSLGIASALGSSRTTLICLDDYHRYDRAERMRRSVTALSPEGNRLELMAGHLTALRRGESITKPVYDHHDGTFGPDEVVRPLDVVIARGLLGLHTDALARCFDLSVFLDPEPALRVQWKIARDCAKRGYTPAQVLEHIDRRRPDAERYIAPQRQRADLVIRFARPQPLDGAGVEEPLDLQVIARATPADEPRRPATVRLMAIVETAAEAVRGGRAAPAIPLPLPDPVSTGDAA